MIDDRIIFEKDNNSLSYFEFNLDKTEKEILDNIPENLLNSGSLELPVMSENQVVRHYINLSNKNYGVDTGFYPLGSCTMKYNPKINEKIASNRAFTDIHPYSEPDKIQGALRVMYETGYSLLEITGMQDITFSPCAGAHGELTGLFVIKAYFEDKNENRKYVLIPDSAHGTNPASASMAGFKTRGIKTTPDGFVDINDLREKTDNDVACLMLTNPNTLGLFEKDIEEIINICKKYDIQMYYDGANLNAFLGICRPGDMGFDVVHINLHKTFSTPHGGGGPGSGPVSVKKHLADFLPGFRVVQNGEKYNFEKRIKSIGKMRAFYANFLIVVRALVYIKSLGSTGLKATSLISMLNANYLEYLLKDHFNIAAKNHVMHEFVISLNDLCRETGITVMDFAKRILDYGYHAPTVSFPLIVKDCLMIEPTETEVKQTLDDFADVLIKIQEEARENPELLKQAPVKTPVKRIDEVTAARQPVLRYTKDV